MVDLVTLFAICILAVSWFFFARTAPNEPLVRMFWGAMPFMAAAIGVLGLILRFVR